MACKGTFDWIFGEQDYISDTYGERGILVGDEHRTVEPLFRGYAENATSEDMACKGTFDWIFDEQDYESDTYGKRGFLVGDEHGTVEPSFRGYAENGMSEDMTCQGTLDWIFGEPDYMSEIYGERGDRGDEHGTVEPSCRGYAENGMSEDLAYKDADLITWFNLKTISTQTGLWKSCRAFAAAQAAGFTKENETFGQILRTLCCSLVLFSISVASQADCNGRLFFHMKPNSIPGLSHGFLLHHLQSMGHDVGKNFSVISLCPHEIQVKEINAAGINSSVLVRQTSATQFLCGQDVDGMASDVAFGSPFVSATVLEQEYKSNIFVKQVLWLTPVQDMVDTLFERYSENGTTKNWASKNTVEWITGIISKTYQLRACWSYIIRFLKMTKGSMRA